MTSTEIAEQEARATLEKAIRTYFDMVEPGTFIDDWVLVVHKDSVELARNGESMVGHIVPEGQSFHRTVGLLTVARQAELHFTEWE